MDLEGRLLGNRYEILEKVGNGGMATVYKAKCHVLNRYVAVKVLREEFTTDEEFVKRFNTEAQSAASLTHPNIVSVSVPIVAVDAKSENILNSVLVTHKSGTRHLDTLADRCTAPQLVYLRESDSLVFLQNVYQPDVFLKF